MTASPPIIFFGSSPAQADVATIAAIPTNSISGTAPTSVVLSPKAKREVDSAEVGTGLSFI